MSSTIGPQEQDREQVCRTVESRLVDAGIWQAPSDTSEGRRDHLVSTEPFPLSRGQVERLELLGDAILAFYKAVNQLYLGKEHRWAREYLDIGKGEEIIRHAGMKYHKQALPGILRPDVLVTSDGFAITELDSVPGGFGHLDCLSSAYRESGFELAGHPDGIAQAFRRMIVEAAGCDDPVCAIVVSDESEDYRAEMRYLAEALRVCGGRFFCVHPRELAFAEDGLYVESDSERLRVDVLYRFYELFDLVNIPKAELIAYAAKKKLVVITPPYKPFLEEKMLLALLNHHALDGYWRATMGNESFAVLQAAVSPTYIMDPRPVPPHAEISGFRYRGGAIRDWHDIASGTQKERRLVVKPSGFSPLAWGSRGVRIGHDLSSDEWAGAVQGALDAFSTTPYVAQPFLDSAVTQVGYMARDGSLREMDARVRLCPYYFVQEGHAVLAGVLSSACPKNKKLIHGMSDAVMAPCTVRD